MVENRFWELVGELGDESIPTDVGALFVDIEVRWWVKKGFQIAPSRPFSSISLTRCLDFSHCVSSTFIQCGKRI